MLPIIDNITVVPSVIAPGETAVLTILAHDPDSQVGLLSGTVTDLAGNVKAAQVSLTIQDLLSEMPNFLIFFYQSIFPINMLYNILGESASFSSFSTSFCNSKLRYI